MTDSVPDNVIHAEPSKAFFIDMLTKDISAMDCVLDLVDNAIDKVVEDTGLDVMKILELGRPNIRIRKRQIEITISRVSVTVVDNCGGISVDEARNDVFLFGNPEERGARLGLSVYGIGMKRAFFKLGSLINVRSATLTDYFATTINVDKWKAQKDWLFKFDVAGPRTSKVKMVPGTSIAIGKLRPGIGDRMNSTSFSNDLSKRLSTTYALFLKAGLIIKLNGSIIGPKLPHIATTPFTPVRKRIHAGAVSTLIIAGVSPRDDRGAHGWYVFCNGRMVLDADKTDTTGWGDNFPNWASKFNHFVGLVYFRSPDVRQLPWRTTKQGVERESPIYQLALAEMRVQGRPITNFLSELYPSDPQEEGLREREAFSRAKGVAIDKLPSAETPFFVKRKKKGKGERVQIQYSRPRSALERIREHVGRRKLSAARIGELTFDYYIEQELT